MLEAAVLCLAMNMYHEARGESIQSMMAVAEVTMNRVKDHRYPDDVCSVVQDGYRPGHRDCQFSWYCDGRSDHMHEQEYASIARLIAIDYLTGLETNFTDGATHYHATYVNPFWADSLIETATIDSHIFYRWD